MRYQTNLGLEHFDFSGSPIRAISVAGDRVRLSLDEAKLRRGHPDNPQLSAQTIRPCAVHLNGVERNAPSAWVEELRRYGPHPDPAEPLRGAVGAFDITPTADGYAVRITGFLAGRAVVWELDCREIEVSWDDFTGTTWFDPGPLAVLR